MSGAGFILAINLAVAGLLAAAFVMIAVYDKSRVSARWLASGYLLGMAYYAVESVIPLLGNARAAVVLSFGVFLGAMAVFNIGVARKYDVVPPFRLMVALFVASVVAVYLIQDLPRHSFTWMMAYQAPYFLMQSISAAIIVAASPPRLLDRLLAVLFGASALQFLSKPFLAYALGGWGANPQAYLSSNYALVSQSMGTVSAMAIALMLFVVLVRDILDDVTAKSETDALSGLLNRRGFESRAEAALRAALRQRMPVALVICDLDHFKSVNDSYGHAAGDKVIEAFAGFLGSATDARYAAGRIGGEEFAIILPGTNLVAARLFAEGARSAFAGLAVDGLPPDRRFTASFGVAERLPGEGISDLMRRADEALYEAKAGGRDCVRVWLPGSEAARQVAV